MDLKQINNETDLVGLVGGELRKTGRYHVGACPFCGGQDRFTIKHTGQGDRWHCRHCGDGKYHTAIDFIMRRDGIDFKTAYLKLTGGKLSSTHPRPFAKPGSRPLSLPSDEWQAKALKHMDAASDRLLDPEEGLTGRNYLIGRGLSRALWMAWHLGFSMEWDPKTRRKRPAIVIPWLDMDAERDLITAVKYRFIDDDPQGLRYISMTGSVPLLFGLWDVIDLDTKLLLVEGEMNALSIWQCRPRGVSVLSFGSQSGGRPDILKAVVGRYQRIFIWCDDAERTMQVQAMLGRSCSKLQSPDRDGVKMDANALLKTGELSIVLSRIFEVECMGRTANRKPVAGDK